MGRLYNRAGVLVCTVAQEGLIRPLQGGGRVKGAGGGVKGAGAGLKGGGAGDGKGSVKPPPPPPPLRSSKL